MTQVITREWEITKTYIFEVAMRDGLVNLDWYDFEMMAQGSRPAVAVKVDEPLSLSELTTKAIDEVKRNIKGTLSSVIIAISFNKDKAIMMEEMGGVNDCLSCLYDGDVDITWGVLRTEEITNNRCVTVFAFEK